MSHKRIFQRGLSLHEENISIYNISSVLSEENSFFFSILFRGPKKYESLLSLEWNALQTEFNNAIIFRDWTNVMKHLWSQLKTNSNKFKCRFQACCSGKHRLVVVLVCHLN